MQIGKILFWINVNLCFQYDGWPSGMEMPPTSMYGDHHARWGKSATTKKPNKNLKPSFAGLPWTPWRQHTTRQQPSTWIIHPGRTPHPNCDKVAIPCKKMGKSRSRCKRRPVSQQLHDLDTRDFSEPSVREAKMPRSVKFVKGISPKNWLQSTFPCSFKFSFGSRLSFFWKRIFRLHVCTELQIASEEIAT